MKQILHWAALSLAFVAVPLASAAAPEASPRPELRPGAVVEPGPLAAIRPMPRPLAAAAAPADASDDALRPALRPDGGAPVVAEGDADDDEGTLETAPARVAAKAPAEPGVAGTEPADVVALAEAALSQLAAPEEPAQAAPEEPVQSETVAADGRARPVSPAAPVLARGLDAEAAERLAERLPTPRPAEPEASASEVGRAALQPAHAALAALRPQARPAVARKPAAPIVADTPAAPIVANKPARVVLASSGAAVRLSPRPDLRPQNIRRRSVVRATVRSQPAPPLLKGRRGSVCGDNTIQGQRLGPIPGRLAGCGVSEPVRVTSVSGVALTQPSTMDCVTAQALKNWVDRSVKPTVGRLGGGVASLKVIAHYSCRTRNNKPGAKISEHGKGRALDIAAINLKNGVSLSVLKGWRDPTQGPLLKAMHRAACGPFGTVLGPKADRYHQDHFHFDTARYRAGPYCR